MTVEAPAARLYIRDMLKAQRSKMAAKCYLTSCCLIGSEEKACNYQIVLTVSVCGLQERVATASLCLCVACRHRERVRYADGPEFVTETSPD